MFATKLLSIRSFHTSRISRDAQQMTSKSWDNLLVQVQDRVGIITLNRPKALNALSTSVFTELNQVMYAFDKDPKIKAIVLTGSEKAFAAGADIKEMAKREFVDNYNQDFLATWTDITKVRKPIIAAVNGFALGGGCELAMMCDIIYAGSNAKFAQPEIKLATIPGAGGTQRLTKAIGKSRAMELCLTGEMMGAEEALSRGLVSKVFEPSNTVPEAISLAKRISEFSLPAILMVKESVNKSFETSLKEGLDFERRMFHSTFATHDQKEGMGSFAEKREAKFLDK